MDGDYRWIVYRSWTNWMRTILPLDFRLIFIDFPCKFYERHSYQFSTFYNFHPLSFSFVKSFLRLAWYFLLFCFIPSIVSVFRKNRSFVKRSGIIIPVTPKLIYFFVRSIFRIFLHSGHSTSTVLYHFFIYFSLLDGNPTNSQVVPGEFPETS